MFFAIGGPILCIEKHVRGMPLGMHFLILLAVIFFEKTSQKKKKKNNLHVIFCLPTRFDEPVKVKKIRIS